MSDGITGHWTRRPAPRPSDRIDADTYPILKKLTLDQVKVILSCGWTRRQRVSLLKFLAKDLGYVVIKEEEDN